MLKHCSISPPDTTTHWCYAAPVSCSLTVILPGPEKKEVSKGNEPFNQLFGPSVSWDALKATVGSVSELLLQLRNINLLPDTQGLRQEH